MVFLSLSFPIFSNGECGAQFLKIGVGARAVSLGSAYSSIADDATATFWNPAGIAQTNNYSLHIMHSFMIFDMSYQFFGFIVPTKIGNWGISSSYSHSGTFEKYENFEKIGTYKAFDLALQLSYSKKLFDNLYLGLTIKGIHQEIDEYDAQAIAGDLGVLYKLKKLDKLRFGISCHNLGKGIRFISLEDPLPLYIRLGTSFHLNTMIFSIDLNKKRDYKVESNIGAEYNIDKLVFLRCGYSTTNSVSVGTGISIRKISVDYAFKYLIDISPDHFISLGVNF